MQFPTNPTDALVAMSAFKCGTDDPTVTPTQGATGQIYVMMGFAGSAVDVFQKLDDGISTNWTPLGGGALLAIPGYYPVIQGGKYPDVQSAIDQAVLDGFGDLNPALVQVFPGVYTGDAILQNGINVRGVDEVSCIIDGEFSFVVPAGGAIAGSQTRLSELTFKQQAGKPSLSITDTNPADQANFILDFCTFIAPIVGQTASTLSLLANQCFLISNNITGSADSYAPGAYFYDFALAPQSQHKNWYLFSGGPMVHVNSGRQCSFDFCRLFVAIGIGIDVEGGGAILSLGDCAVIHFSGGACQLVNLIAAGATVNSINSTYFAQPGDLVWQGIAGANANALNNVFLFSADYSMAITLGTFNTTPNPV